MLRADLRSWRWRLLAALVVMSPALTRADVAPDFCEVERIERYLGERCVVCEASEFEPERCRQHFAATNLRQRCAGVTTVSSSGGSWGELWCLPRGSTDPLPSAPPPIERVDEPGFRDVPKIPPDFRDPPPLAPAADSSSLPSDLDPSAAPTTPPASAPAPATAPTPAPTQAPTPASACGGCSAGDPAVALLVVALLGRRRRRGQVPENMPARTACTS